MNINWYPGHMKKTKDMILENLKIIDVIIELVDARVPLSSKNPEISNWSKNKTRIILLNKSDLVREEDLKKWEQYFLDNNYADEVIPISALKGENLKKIFSNLAKYKAAKEQKMKKKGVKKCSLRLLIAGIPNVGKSLLINKIAKRKAAGVGNKPGFTKGKQWIKLQNGIEMLDTPGILWPKFDNEKVGINLALTGAIRQDILDEEQLSQELIGRILNIDPKLLNKYFEKEISEEIDTMEVLIEIAKNKNSLIKGGGYDLRKVALMLLNDYKNGKLGKFCLEHPSDFELKGE